jgi:hypothetical protein
MGDSFGILLEPPNSPAVLIHWRALIELLGLMPAQRRVALCSLRFPLASSQGFGSSGEPPAVRPKVVKPEEPMDWSQGGMGSGDSVGRVPAEGQRGDEGLWVFCTSGGASLQFEASAVPSSGRFE